jgi:hypothetical protein
LFDLLRWLHEGRSITDDFLWVIGLRLGECIEICKEHTPKDIKYLHQTISETIRKDLVKDISIDQRDLFMEKLKEKLDDQKNEQKKNKGQNANKITTRKNNSKKSTPGL